MRYRDFILAKALGRGAKGAAVGFPAMLGVSGGGTEYTVTGVSPLVLAAALRKPVSSLVQTGVCEQASTPTPSTPVDIYCNNGRLVAVDDELPAAYKRVLGFACNNNAMWVIDNFHLKGSDTVRISFSIAAACNVWGCYQGTSATDNYDLYATTTSGGKYLRYADGTYDSYFSTANQNVRFNVVYTPTGTTGMPTDSTWAARTFESANDLIIGSTTLTGSSAKMKGNFYGSIEVDGRLKLIPCERVSDGVLGYYDTYSETFYEPYTGYDGAVSLGYDGSHYSVEVVGTDEVITLCGKNLLNPATDTVGAYINQNGEIVPGGLYRYTDIIPVKPGKYVISGTSNPTTGQTKRVHGYLNGVWQSQLNSLYVAKDAAFSIPITVPNGVDGIRFSYYTNDVDVMIEAGETATAYAPYAGQTASAVDLFAVGDYADTQEIISGAVTRKVGITILTGEETGWALSDSGTTHRFRGTKPSDCITPSNRGALLSTHFTYISAGQTQGGAFIGASQYWYFIPTDQTIDTADKWKAWLKAQYAQGTPVIVIYPLATETTESVAAQTLHTNAGDNTITVTAEVSDIPLSATYIKEAS
jgi:hypothetical protein